MDVRRRKATRRLHKDLQELADRSWELPTVSALPLEDNILEWHCNIVGSGDHEGVVLHLKLLFPETYPHQPPEVVLMSRVCHPNVFEDHVCMDMLEEGQWSSSKERDAEFTGWSTSYSVFSILMQLQAFLFDLGNNARRTAAAAARCTCFCGHGVDRVYPPLPTPVPPPPRALQASDPFAEIESESTTRAPSEAAQEETAGNVTRVEPYGYFIRLQDGEVGLLHSSQVARHVRFEVGERVSCRVRSRTPRLSLTTLRSEAEITALATQQTRIPATVTGVKPFGAFVDLGGFSALLHTSEMNLLPGERAPHRIGETVSVRILPSVHNKLAVSERCLCLKASQPRQLLHGDADLARLQCFHAKLDFHEAVLGVGVGIEAEEVAQGQTRHHLTSVYDALAHESFQDGVRKGVWKQKFCEFLPLALDGEHFRKAQRCLEDGLARLASGRLAELTRSHGKSREDREAEFRARITFDEYKKHGAAALPQAPASMTRPAGSSFTPEMVFEIIPKLMNSQVVLLSSGQLWRCEKALEGYFAYHHLLLHCLQTYPGLRYRMETKLEAFVQDASSRGKDKVHNLGEFLCLVSVSDKVCWENIGIPLLEEAFDRNALWILKKHPALGALSDTGVSKARLRQSLNANIVSLRLLMFQVAFLRLAKPAHLHAQEDDDHSSAGTSSCFCRKASCMLASKDRCKGLPGPGQAEWLFDRCVEILEVEDFHEFLDLVGAADMTDAEMCCWLRHSIIRSIGKGYHNPRHFIAKKPSEDDSAAGPVDPEDFGLDTRAKEGKAAKRARRRALIAARATASEAAKEYNAALSWARFSEPWMCRQACLFLDENDFEELKSALDSDGALSRRFRHALPGYRLLDHVKLTQVKDFPCRLWLGMGCRDCGKQVRTESSGRCMACCRIAAKAPAIVRPIKGMTGESAPVATFAAYQAQVVLPVQFEVHLEVGFDGLQANLDPLRKLLSDDLILTGKLSGATVFSRVERAGKRLWEASPEQTLVPGTKLVSGFQGITDALFSVEVRGRRYTLLQETMHEMSRLDQVEQLKFARTFCHDHLAKDPKTKEVLWNTPCKNCRGILRLRYAAPTRWAERREQLLSMSAEQLAKRCLLTGLGNMDLGGNSEKRDEAINNILKAERIVR
mmetsp:Transcript_5920/g.13021  ORF Transcript_5920/g.13021 Transcript_5920/m.13021 type:complete len:1136 (-) Transcript_5920:372-3779(-)|eukprot:CAMPEP_0178424404 /NCGR_PEP_ID=MMETSP0689_2-20121128/28191_1 /TAXON_ID=160604 /ORGANISM="Amphidinium massartii, Strain CS-259" /LENGTH=1135 /DNA_ID=CAMNT_0020046037 /DNA_START=29 /DNA_END=3436 /DNA_ORIENTATION=-